MPSNHVAALPVDVTAWVGGLPYRDVPHPEPAILVRVLEREGFGGAWVGSLPAACSEDPAAETQALRRAVAPFRHVLSPVPTLHPAHVGWEQHLRDALSDGAPAIRIYPSMASLVADQQAWQELADACAQAGLVLQCMLRVDDLSPSARVIRPDHAVQVVHTLLGTAAARRSPVLLVCGATTRDVAACEAQRPPSVAREQLCYDLHWLHGPPGGATAAVAAAVGPPRLALSSWWPVRLTQYVRSLLELWPQSVAGDDPWAACVDGRQLVARAKAGAAQGPFV